jgi:DNA-binding GntR family transcriptional regulator
MRAASPRNPPDIGEAVISAILGGNISPGAHLGEQALADIFGVSRTRVREALMRLEARGVVQVSARKGWFVVTPSAEEARDAFQARRVIEGGLIHSAGAQCPACLRALRGHVDAERAAIQAGDVGGRTCLLGDFHVHLAAALSNRVVVEILRDLTARTTLISMLYQSSHKATESQAEHVGIVAALEAGDFPGAARLMDQHLHNVEAGLDLSARPDPLAALRESVSRGLTNLSPRPGFPRQTRNQLK